MSPIPDHAQPGARRLSEEDLTDLLPLVPHWQRQGGHIERVVLARDFKSALDLIQRVGDVAEREDHHPDLHLESYRRVTFRLSTHDAGGLTHNDFVLAREIDRLIGAD